MVMFENDPSFVIKQAELRRAVRSIQGIEDLSNRRHTSIHFSKNDTSVIAKSESSDYASEIHADVENLRDFADFALDGFFLNRFLPVVETEIDLSVSLKKNTDDSTAKFVFSNSDLKVEMFQQGLRIKGVSNAS